MGCHVFLQGISPAQGLNPGLLNHTQILYHWATRVDHILILWICYIAWQKKIKIEDEIKLWISPLECREIVMGYLDESSLITLKHRNRGQRVCQRDKTWEELDLPELASKMEKGDQELKNADVPRRQEGIVLNYSRQGNGNPGLITANELNKPGRGFSCGRAYSKRCSPSIHLYLDFSPVRLNNLHNNIIYLHCFKPFSVVSCYRNNKKINIQW